METHVKEISERLVRKGIEINVLTTDPSGELVKEEVINNVLIKRFKSWAPNEAYFFSKDLRYYLKRFSDTFDVVHAHSYHAFPAYYAALGKGTNKLIFTAHYHGTGHTFFRKILLGPYRFLGKKIFEKADRVICVSNYERKLVTKHFKIEEDKIILVPNGFNLEEFKYLKKKTAQRIILYVGRLEKYKGVHHLIKAMPKLDPDIVLEIVGKGPYRNNLIKMASKLGLERRVRFLHDLSREELLQKYAEADLFALLSQHEAYGICVGEALASGTPCIVANTSALTEWIDNQNCFGIEQPINSDELASSISRTIGRSVKDVKLPDWNETADKLAKLYECT